MSTATATKTTHYNVVLRHRSTGEVQTLPFSEAALREALVRYRTTSWRVLRVEKVTTMVEEIPNPVTQDRWLDRCPYVATDPITTRRPRVDGWRCGESAYKPHNHTLYSADGEHVLYAGHWVLPEL